MPAGRQFSAGDRVVVRTRLPEGAEKRFSDVIGIVISDDDETLTLQRDAAGYDRGDVSNVAVVRWDTVESAKKVPPRPDPRAPKAEPPTPEMALGNSPRARAMAKKRVYTKAGDFHTGAPPIALLGRMAELDRAIEPTIYTEPVKYSLGDIAEITGSTVEHVFDLTRWIGSVPRDATTKYLTAWDLEAVQAAVDFQREEHLDDAAISTLLRGMGFAMERLTTRQVEAVIQSIETTQGVGDTEARLLAAAAAPKQAPLVLTMLSHVYRRHLAISTRRLTTEAIAQRGLLSDDHDYPLVRAVGFADLVDFTKRTEHATAGEFTAMIQNFRDTAWDIVNAGHGRTINYIGDAIFFVADTIEQGADIALALAAPGALGISGPVRAGLVWSRIIATHGDAYGPGVNLAARLCAAAEPDEVLIGPLATAMLNRSPKYQVVRQPDVDAHGIGPVTASRLRHADDPRNSAE